jgi:phage shock protein E
MPMKKTFVEPLLVLLAAVSLLACAKPPTASVVALSARQAETLLAQNSDNPDFVVLDIRTAREYAQGHIPRAVLLDYYDPTFKAGLQRLDRDKIYFIYCRSGNRSGRALKLIEPLGFKKIYHLENGIIDWRRQNLRVVTS